MSGYAHCRGCGRALSTDYDNPELDDGLCMGASSNSDCTGLFIRWWSDSAPAEKAEFDTANRGTESWKGGLWTVKVDQWLAATR